MPKTTFKVGDTVMWKGCFGADAPRKAVIESMEISEHRRCKYGTPVDEAPVAKRDFLVVNLTNGSWAYGSQISPL